MAGLMKKRRGIFGLVSILLLFTVLLAACGGSSGDDDDDSGAAVMEETGRTADSGGVEAFDSDDAGASAESEPVSDSASAFAPSYVANQVPFDRLIIQTVTIDLTVEDVSQGSNWIRELASRKGGFVFSSNTYVRDENEFAQITIRVPADQLDSTVGELREHSLVIQVDSEETTSQDVSQEYVDNESRLEALEETQRRFLALLSEADTVEEILRIESELTNIRTQIETIKGRQNYLDQMTSFSTITITLHTEDEGFEIEEQDDENFIARIFGDAWDNASGVIEGILGGTITLAIIGLAVLPVALLFWFVGRAVYRRVQGPRVAPSTGTKMAEQPASETAD
ncbi:hypothetical protein BH23CHL2_BH23CHL2_30330 [soil metagenome]